MYYLELIERFWTFNQNANIGSKAITIYLYLLKLGKDNGGYDVTISDVALSNTLGITKKTVKSTKEKLRDLGLIQYETKNGLPCHYRILLNYPLEIYGDGKHHKTKNKNEPEISSDEEPKILQTAGSPKKDTRKTEEKDIVPFNSKSNPFKTVNQPSLEEFFEYARTLEAYETFLDSHIKEKYDAWLNNDWKNNSGKLISNWKSSLKSTLPYLKNLSEENPISLQNIPKIKRPESERKNH